MKINHRINTLRYQNKGFTLIELLAVIVILAIILVIAVPQILGVIEQTKKDTLNIDAGNIAKSLEIKRVNESINVELLTIDNLTDFGIDKTKYDGFGATLINNKVVVTLTKGNYVGENTFDSKVYGVSWNGTGSTLTRTNDSLTLTNPTNTNCASNLFNMQNWNNYLTTNQTNSSYPNYTEFNSGYNYVAVHPSGHYTLPYMENQFLSNTQYTISFYARQENVHSGGTTTGFSFNYTDGSKSAKMVNNDTNWTFYSLTSTAGKTVKSIKLEFNYDGYVWFSNVMLVQGTTIGDCGGYTSGFDTAEIYSEMTEVTDTYGNVFIKIPKFYIKKTTDGTNWTWQISKSKKDNDYYLPSCFYDEQSKRILPYILVGKYDANLSTDNTKLESKTGKVTLVNKTISQFRTLARANNSGVNQGYQLIDIHVVDVLQTLFYVEYATLDSQSIMQGYTTTTNTSALNSGTTDSVSTASGSPTSNSNGLYAMKYRGIENLYGNVWQFVDGINIQNNYGYVARDSSQYATDVYNGAYTKLSYINANTNNHISKMGYDSNNPFVQLPIEVNAGNTTYKDYYYQNTGNRIAFFCGSWYNGPTAGVSSWSLYDGPSISGSSIGSRFLKIPL